MQITNKFGYPLHQISTKHADCLSNVLLNVVDDEPDKFKKIVEQHQLNGQGFYTHDKKRDHYELILIDLDAWNPLIIDSFTSFKNMINNKPIR